MTMTVKPVHRPQSNTQRQVTLSKPFSALIGCLMGITLPVGGNLTGAEALTICVAAFVAVGSTFSKKDEVGRANTVMVIVALLAISIVNLILADVSSQDNFEIYYKTWIRFIIIPVTLLSVSLLVRKGYLNIRYVFLFGIAGLAIAVITKAEYISRLDVWKFNIAAWLIAGCLAGLPRRSTILTSCVLLGFAILNAYFGYRTMLLLCALCGVSILAVGPLGQLRISPRARATLLLTLLAVAGVIGGLIYNYAASSGALGASVQGKHLAQVNAYGGFFLASRPEALVAVKAALKHPITGQGSNPRDSVITGEYIHQVMAAGQYYVANFYDRERVPIHSLIFDAWIRSGIFGGAAWLTIMWISIRYVLAGISDRKLMDPLGIFLAMFMVWNILFSPMSSQLRYYACLTICMIAGSRGIESKGRAHIGVP